MESLILQRAQSLVGEVVLPTSKSISNRVLLLDRLAGGNGTLLTGVADCDDTKAVLAALASTDETKDIGAAGTAMRFLTAYYTLLPGQVVMTGCERMRHRPISILVDALRQMGGHVTYAGEEGFPPLRIEGGYLHGGTVRIDGSVSSQYISALLMIAPCLEEGLTLEFIGEVASRPYIEMTLSLMRRYGAMVVWQGNGIRVAPGGYAPRRYAIEGDWSASSYWYEALALCRDPKATVELIGLQQDSLQGDSWVAQGFAALGVHTTFTERGVLLTKVMPTQGVLELDFSHQPDLAQTFVATCCALGRPFRFTGLESLKIKETDRIAALQQECAKFGWQVEEPCLGSLLYDGTRQSPQPHICIATYGDHRMAMAFAPLSLVEGALTIESPEVVSKSYPGFWEDWKKIVTLYP